MLLAASNVHYRNNLILGKSETLETFAVETNTNYSSSDYNGFRPNEGAEFSFEWSTPPLTMRSELPGRAGTLSTQQQTQFEAKHGSGGDSRRSKEYSDATGQDRHSVLVDYDVFVKVTPPDPDPRTLYKPADFDFQLRPGSVAVDAGVRLPGVNDDFTGRAPGSGRVRSGSAGAALRAEAVILLPMNCCRLGVPRHESEFRGRTSLRCLVRAGRREARGLA